MKFNLTQTHNHWFDWEQGRYKNPPSSSQESARTQRLKLNRKFINLEPQIRWDFNIVCHDKLVVNLPGGYPRIVEEETKRKE